MSTPDASRLIVMGQVTGLFGVRGWVKLRSFTEPREGILGYADWHLGTEGDFRPVRVAEGRRQGRGVVARLEGVDDRDTAAAFIGAQIAVPRSSLPPLEKGRYYWADLEGLRVRNRDGVELGTVTRLMPTPANDVLVVRGERDYLIPFVMGDRVVEVDLARGEIVVDWEPDW